MTTTNLIKGKIYSDGQYQFCKFVEYDKSEDQYIFIRLRPSDKSDWYRIYLSSFSVQDRVKSIN